MRAHRLAASTIIRMGHELVNAGCPGWGWLLIVLGCLLPALLAMSREIRKMRPSWFGLFS